MPLIPAAAAAALAATPVVETFAPGTIVPANKPPKFPDFPSITPPKVEEKVVEAITPEAQAKAKEEEKKKISSKKKNTILTGPLGILSETPVGKKTLLGE